jgi:hypothetical protein
VSTNRLRALFRRGALTIGDARGSRQPARNVAWGYFFFADFFDEVRFVLVDFFDEDFFAEPDFFDDDFFDDDFFDDDFFEDDFFEDDFFDDDFFDDDFFDDDFFDGTLPPSRLASERPMAMACLRLVTFLPERPLFNLPRFISCMFSSTLSDAFLPYLLAMKSLLHRELCKWRARGAYNPRPKGTFPCSFELS